MLLKVDLRTSDATRVRGQRLGDFGLREKDLQDILFRSLDRLLPDDELLLIMQSHQWQEEPDLMAIDKAGHLYIFELKAWEAQSENLLQVLRYGQLYGSYTYDSLQHLYEKTQGTNRSLQAAHEALFGSSLGKDEFNHKQVFVVLTNGLDYRTREAVQYWRKCGLDLRPWVYRVYKQGGDEMGLEISPFAVNDNPYSDLAEGYYILNTNYRNSQQDHADMLANHKAAAYFEPWKFKIERLSKGDVVFLYQSGKGIVAVGKASGKLGKCAYQGNSQHPDEEYFMPLTKFKELVQPVTAAEIKELAQVEYRFMGTMFALDAESGERLCDHIAHLGIGNSAT